MHTPKKKLHLLQMTVSMNPMQPTVHSVLFRVLQGAHIARHSVSTWSDSMVHTDPFSRLYYIGAGRGRLVYDGKTVRLAPGHLYLFPAGRPIRHYASPGLDHYYVHFVAQLPGGLSLFDLTAWRCRQSCGNCDLTGEQMKRLIKVARTPAQLLEQQATLQWMVAGFMRSFRHDLQERLARTERFGTVVEYIQQHVNVPIAIPKLARLAALHPNYFSNLFTASFGVSPREYIVSKRIERAQLLLWQSDQPVKQIADAVGYDNAAYFCRIFKRRTGVTPGTYRRQRQRAR